MRSIAVSNQTLLSPMLKNASFRQKLEAARKLDHLGLEAVETPEIADPEGDMLLMRSLWMTVKRSALCCRTGITRESVAQAWDAVRGAKKPRLAVALPLSSAQLEYFCHLKSPKALALIGELVSAAKALCPDVEFVCEDAVRAERNYVIDAVKAAVDAGAGRITLCDSAGQSLPEEIAALVRDARAAAGKGTVLAVRPGNELGLAISCAVAALQAGADEVKTSCLDENALSAVQMARLFRARGADLQLESPLDITRVERTAAEIRELLADSGKNTPFDAPVFSRGGEETLPAGADDAALQKAVLALGYDLNEEDAQHVRDAVAREGKGRALTRAELEAVILSSAQQVPATYRLRSYLINSGTAITATAHVTLEKNGELLSGLCAGDGPIDAAFLAIEQIIGCHYEMDDFQIAAVTQNREAMGDALVKLRCGGRVYAGKGISTDINGAAIRAYLNALNKIAYEEKTV